MKTIVMSLCALLMVSAAVAHTARTLAGWTIYLRRAGAIGIGMSLSQVRQTLGDRNASLQGNGPGAAGAECAYLRSARKPDDVRIMFAHGRVVRVEVVKPGIRTASGIGIGSTEEDVQRVYPGRIQVGPHKYTDGHYLTFVPADQADRGFGLVFETDGRRVTTFRNGTTEAVALVEGCS